MHAGEFCPMAFIDDVKFSLDELKGAFTLRNTTSIDKNLVHFTDFSSNDYLGLAAHPLIVEKAKKTLVEYGIGVAASRLVSGSTPVHEELEQKLASFLGQPSCLVFGAGYLANFGALSVLAGRNDAVVTDRYIHASLIDGIINSRAKNYRYEHNDLDSLESKLKTASSKRRPGQRLFVVTESVFSMDGDLSPLSEIAKLVTNHEAVLFVDEAHAIGVFGEGGRGLFPPNLVNSNCPIIVSGTLSKSLGSYGGFIAAAKEVRDFLVNKSRPFIYNTALPPVCAAAASLALDIIRKDSAIGSRLLEKAGKFRGMLLSDTAGVEVCSGESAIIPIIVGDNKKTLQLARALFEEKILAPAIRPPTVPANKARLRLTVTLNIKESELEHAAEKIKYHSQRIGND